MTTITQELIIIVFLLIVNALFALSEIALVSANKIRLGQLSEKGETKATLALELANNPNQVLSTVQIGITLINIFTGVYTGATIAEKLAQVFAQIPFLAEKREVIALACVVLILSYCWLVVGELVPKRLALYRPDKLAMYVAYPLQALASFFAPIVHLLGCSTDFVLSLLGISSDFTQPSVTQEEIKVLLKQGTEAGNFEVAEQDMVERVLQLGDREVNSLMTPRPEIVWLDLEDSAESNRHKIMNTIHTRFPVCQSSLDNVLGVIQVTSLLKDSLLNKPFDLTASLRQPLFIPETTKALKALESLKQTGTNIALVVDEYGVIQGVVTLNDIMEAVIGDLPRLNQQCSLQAVQRDDGSWLVDGMLAIEDFKRLFQLRELPGESRGNYHTLGGFMITHLGRIPVAADHFEWCDLRFEIMDMDGNRVDKVLVIPLSEEWRNKWANISQDWF